MRLWLSAASGGLMGSAVTGDAEARRGGSFATSSLACRRCRSPRVRTAKATEGATRPRGRHRAHAKPGRRNASDRVEGEPGGHARGHRPNEEVAGIRRPLCKYLWLRGLSTVGTCSCGTWPHEAVSNLDRRLSVLTIDANRERRPLFGGCFAAALALNPSGPRAAADAGHG